MNGRSAGMMTAAADSGDRQIALLSCGPAEHAITDLSRRTADLAVRQGFSGPIGYEPNPARLLDLVAGLPAGIRVVGLQVSDWIYARVDGGAAVAIGAAAEQLARRGAAFVLTLHDLPRPGPDGLFESRAAGYRELAAAADAVVVCSRYERDLLAALGADPGRCAVLPLPVDVDTDLVAPVDRPPADPVPPAHPFPPADLSPRGHPVPPAERTVGIFGFLYPGKGHREVIEALAGTGITVLALGRPSDGQEYLLGQLTELARQRGVTFEITGYLPAGELGSRLRRVGVPVCPHTAISASASINAWIGAGRRPLVADGPYAAELAERMPGALSRFPPEAMRARIQAALNAPEQTWWPAGTPVGPSSDQIAARYLTLLRGIPT